MALEKTVSFKSGEHMIVGTVCDAKAPQTATFLLLHGFAGTRDELLIPSVGIGIFEYVASRLADLGHSSLRIDFRGWGDSDGAIEETSYSTQIDDCLTAMDLSPPDPILEMARSSCSAGAKADWSQQQLLVGPISHQGWHFGPRWENLRCLSPLWSAKLPICKA